MIGERRILLLALLLGVGLPLSAQESASPVGTWRGESKCQVRPSECRDEEALYRVTAAQQPDHVNVSGNKIVDGKEVHMGVSDCRYDVKSGTIDCTLPNGNSIHLDLNGNAMEGAFRLRDGTLWRKITLHRVEKQ